MDTSGTDLVSPGATLSNAQHPYSSLDYEWSLATVGQVYQLGSTPTVGYVNSLSDVDIYYVPSSVGAAGTIDNDRWIYIAGNVGGGPAVLLNGQTVDLDLEIAQGYGTDDPYYSFVESYSGAYTLTAYYIPNNVSSQNWLALIANNLSGVKYAIASTPQAALNAMAGTGSTTETPYGSSNAAPVITPHSQSVTYNQAVAFSSLYSVTGSGITQYKVWFGDAAHGAPALGTLTNNGTAVATDQPVTLTSLSGLVYTGSAAAGTDKIWLEAYNGSWDSAGWVEVDLADQGASIAAPVITPHSQSVAYNQAVPFSNLYSVTGSGITQYKVWFGDAAHGLPAKGTLTNNGTAVATDQAVTLSSLSGLVYTGSAASGTDKIWLEAYNGSWDSAGWVEVDIADQGASIAAPVITPHSQSVAYNQAVPFSNLYTVTGSGITQYKVWFGDAAHGLPAKGTLTNNGTAVATDQAVTLSSLSGLVYTGSAAAGTDKIWLEAYNGSWDSAGWVEVDLADQGASIAAPVITPHSQSVAYSQAVPFSNLYSVTGSGITQYKVWFGDAAHGSPALGTLTNNGIAVATDQAVTLSSLSGLVYTGSAASGTDKIWLEAYNGSWDSAGWVEVDLADQGASIAAPVITPHSQTVAYSQSVPFSNLYSVTGSGITQYKVWFGDAAHGLPALGTLTNNGIAVATDQTITLSSLSGLVYTGSAASGTDKIWLEAYNGSWDSAGWVEVDLADQGAGIAAPVITPHSQSVASNQAVAFSNLYSVTGSGITQYKVWFGDAAHGTPAKGTLTNNGAAVATDQAVTLSSLSGLVYTGSATSGTDKIWLEAYNGSWDSAGWVEVDITDQGTAPQIFQRTGSEISLTGLTAYPTPTPDIAVVGFNTGSYQGDYGVIWSATTDAQGGPNVLPAAIYTSNGAFVTNPGADLHSGDVVAGTVQGNLATAQTFTAGATPMISLVISGPSGNTSGVLVTGQANHVFSDASITAGTDTIAIAHYDVANGTTALKLELTSENNFLHGSGGISDTTLTIAAPSGWSYNPSVSYPTHLVQELTGADNFVINWEGQNGNSSAEWLSLVDHSGHVLQTRELDPSVMAGNSISMVATGDGNVAMAVDYAGRVAFELINGSSLATISKVTVNPTAALPNETNPQIALLKNGDFVLAWHEYDNGTPVIDAQVLDSTGHTIGSVITVSADAGLTDKLGVAALSNGGFVVSWVNATAQSATAMSQLFLPVASQSNLPPAPANASGSASTPEAHSYAAETIGQVVSDPNLHHTFDLLT
ncbi:hypothetical protein G8O24_39835 [Bradyrhizobium sp. INPA01-394B]|uniref:Uncharacterized protein n=1 Tax=Bradyrhizobium campsiandrae TaxID=1729892 RepID=A0ABR7TYH4_9BRAD|nr:hypothetical protein [Bradyrhizobium campsiandrae]MBC9883441.1 hypothetical protein [Bradyrhizobium campsiandrae]MBC9976683.1 hypothetical protein [Bradyrhizobium campsiandrae]